MPRSARQRARALGAAARPHRHTAQPAATCASGGQVLSWSSSKVLAHAKVAGYNELHTQCAIKAQASSCAHQAQVLPCGPLSCLTARFTSCDLVHTATPMNPLAVGSASTVPCQTRGEATVETMPSQRGT